MQELADEKAAAATRELALRVQAEDAEEKPRSVAAERDALVDKLWAVTEEREAAEGERDTLAGRVHAAEGERDAAADRLRSAEGERDAAADRLHTAEACLAEEMELRARPQNSLNRLTEDLQRMERRADDLQAALLAAEAETACASEGRQHAEDALAGCKRQAEDESAALRKLCSEQAAGRAAAETALMEAKELHERQQGHITLQEAQLRSQEEQLIALAEDLRHAHRRAEELRQHVQAAEAAAAEAVADKEQAVSAAADLQRQCQELTQGLSSLQIAVAEKEAALNERLGKADAEAAETSAQHEQAMQQLAAEHDATLGRMKAELCDAADRLAASEQELHALRGRASEDSDLKRQHSDYVHRIEAAHAEELAALRQVVQAASAAAAEREAEVEDLGRRLSAVSAEAAAQRVQELFDVQARHSLELEQLQGEHTQVRQLGCLIWSSLQRVYICVYTMLACG